MTQVTATDADDPTYGNSARVVYSILHGQPYFSVDPKTGKKTLHSKVKLLGIEFALITKLHNYLKFDFSLAFVERHQ